MYPVTKDFLGKPAPPGYVAGLGRGATGFTTRSDIGPAREASKPARNTQPEAADDQQRYTNEDDAGLFSNGPYSEDDEEADRVWQSIEDRMASRRAPRPAPQSTTDNPTIEAQFKDLKRGLSQMSSSDWEAIPEVSQLAETAARAKRHRKQAENRRGERLTQVPDSVMLQGLASAGHEDTTNFMALGEARDRVLELKLDQAGDSVSGKTTIDPRGYLTSLDSVAVRSAAEIGDIGRARTLLRSVVQTNPKHAPGWIAAARLEEVANKPARAREVIAEACAKCPKSVDVWIEAARLSSPNDARRILASAVREIPTSVRIWVAAADLERDSAAKRKVLRRALEVVPTSVQLWKAAVQLEAPGEARILLAHAVELVPRSIDLWLALARLETYTNAQKVLNRARRAVPTSHEIWFAAAQLEEQGGKATRVPMIMRKAVESLAANGAAADRESWLERAAQSERDGCPKVAAATVAATAQLGLEDAAATERVDVWTAEAARYAHHDTAETARAILEAALDVAPRDVGLWRSAAALERAHGTDEQLKAVLRHAVEHCPQAEELWLSAATEMRVRMHDVAGARLVLEEAFAANPQSEAILLAAVQLESESDEFPRALALLARARTLDFGGNTGTPRIWMKSAVLLRELDQPRDALSLATDAISLFPKAYKLWLIKAQIEASLNDHAQARATLSRALKSCPTSPDLWLAAAQLETEPPFALHTRARAILERARVYNPRTPRLWLAAVRLEADELGNTSAAKALVARALQECPTSGILWAEAVLLEPRAQRKTKSIDALRSGDSHDPAIIVVVARLFWAERRVDKARAWFERATKADPDYGDAWAWWLRFECEMARAGGEWVERVEEACERAEPHHGEVWQRIAKDPKNARASTRKLLRMVSEAMAKTRQL